MCPVSCEHCRLKIFHYIRDFVHHEWADDHAPVVRGDAAVEEPQAVRQAGMQRVAEAGKRAELWELQGAGHRASL